MRILIVEDEPTLGRQLKSTLEGVGYALDDNNRALVAAGLRRLIGFFRFIR